MGIEILKALKIRKEACSLRLLPVAALMCLISSAAKAVEERMLPYSNLNIHVAVMGCEVNGPGESALLISESPAAKASSYIQKG